MEWKLVNGDYVPNGMGSFTALSGGEEVLARVLYRLTARRGAMPFLPNLGSRLYQLGREKASARQVLAAQYVAEALREEPELAVESVELTQAAERAGCDAVSVINPYFITLNPEELFAHYAAIAKATRLPVLLYNNPDRTHAVIPLPVIARLAQIENVIGMKDSSGDLSYVNEVLRTTEQFAVFCGKDTVIYQELLSGAAGAVPACANVAPRLVNELYQAVQAGDLARAQQAQRRLTPLRNAFSLGSFPVVMKEALNLMGYEVGAARLPVQPLTVENREKLRAVLQALQLLDA